jgi:predicted nucleic acid-binding Zn ribbon protein
LESARRLLLPSSPGAGICFRPVCGGHIQRVLFAPAIHFKGTGFHNTDYASKKRPGAGEGDGGSAKSNGGGDGAAKSDNGAAASSNGDSGTATKTETAPAKKTVGLDKA